MINRRQALVRGGRIAAGLTLGANLGISRLRADERSDGVFSKIEDIIQAQGVYSDGVFSIEIDRDDIPNVTLHGVPILPSFQINGMLFFQKLDDGTYISNSDMALKPSELDPFIDQLRAHGVVFQAEHQHFYDFAPLVFFIHFRKVGDPLEIARAFKAALNVTSTPFPQTSPSNPTTPLPAEELGDILGASPTIGANGVVNFDVPRAERLRLGEIRINPYLNTATSIGFEPHGGGQNAAGVVDFGLITPEVDVVMSLMRSKGWDVGCLYNQETGEHPQLFFSHQFKTGDSLELAREIREGLNRTNSKFKS